MTRKPALVADAYQVMQEAVAAGVVSGLRRADKHADDVLTEAQRQRVQAAVIEAVEFEMAERFRWDFRR